MAANMAANRELQAAYVAGASHGFGHRDCCAWPEVHDYVKAAAQERYPVKSQPRMVRYDAEPWSAVAGESVEYRVVDGVIEGRNPAPDDGVWRRSETFVLRDGDVYVYPDSPWAGAYELVQALVANPTEEVDG